MLTFKEGQTYVCTKANESWWSEGKKYKVGLSVFNEPFLADDDDDRWSSNDLSVYDSTFKLEKEQLKIIPKEGQTYVCKLDDLDEWTLDKEYGVVFDESLGLVIVDDYRGKWYMPNYSLLNDVFKLKEKTFDLNTLSTEQLKEYVKLLENKENAESALNEFIERSAK